MATEKKKFNLNDSFSELKDIANWFENKNDVDIEEGLKKVKRGVVLVKQCKSRLKEVENEFEEIKKELEE